MEKASARKALVKELRTYARQVKVTQARDDSGRAKVEAMYRKIIAKASVEVKRLVEEKFKAYTETFKTEVATSPAEDTAADAFRLRGKRFLFSYSWDFFGKPLADGTALRSFGTLHARRNIYCRYNSFDIFHARRNCLQRR